ncbi:MAG: Dabb family protein [Bryobacteraceae bacterium]
MKHLLVAVLSLLLLATALTAAAPTSVIHFINVKWKADAKPEQIQAVLDFVHMLPSKHVGVSRVWTKNVKYQGQDGFKQAIVVEFESQDALKKWADSPLQAEWYKLYLPIREESATHDITN